MAGSQNFRTALRGFNREDVVSYIEYMNNKHNSQLAQLSTQLQTAQAELAQLKSAPATQNDLLAELEASQQRCTQLEAELAQCRQASTQASTESRPDDELEAYRRAERTERLARERAAQIYAQANAVLASATLDVDAACTKIGTAADQMSEQLQEYLASVNCAKTTLQDAVAAMYAIRPEES